MRVREGQPQRERERGRERDQNEFLCETACAVRMFSRRISERGRNGIPKNVHQDGILYIVLYLPIACIGYIIGLKMCSSEIEKVCGNLYF